MGFRFALLIGFIVLAYSFLGFRLYELQLKNGDRYLVQAASQSSILAAESSLRGVIYFTDRNGVRVPAATNKDFPLIYAVPKAVKDAAEAANQLGLILNLSPDAILKKLGDKSSDYASILKKASTAAAEKTEELKLQGVYTGSAPGRFYPFGALASQVLGFVGPNESDNGESGKYGLEKFYDKSLAPVATGESGRANVGGDLTLTIDPTIQTEAERVLKDMMSSFKAKGGMVIVEDPETGKILAMGSTPSFDPNSYASSPVAMFQNPVTEQVYEPGSVFKVITMSAGLDAGKITPQTTYYDTGVLNVSGKKIQNWDLKAHGLMTMTNVIEESLNTGAAFAERQIGGDIFKSYLLKFGFGEKTGVDLPGEIKGDLRRLTKNAPAIAYATASFGQGVAVTPLQLINAISAIANGGNLMRPYLNAALEPKVLRQVISASAAKDISAMMVSAVEKAGVAKIDGYTIAGKTGTAQVPDFVHGGYLPKDQSVINTYVGFGPVGNPKFVILVRLNEPEGASLAGMNVVPTFRELAQFIINYLNIPPDKITGKQ